VWFHYDNIWIFQRQKDRFLIFWGRNHDDVTQQIVALDRAHAYTILLTSSLLISTKFFVYTTKVCRHNNARLLIT
jgi:hypothetical protein